MIVSLRLIESTYRMETIMAYYGLDWLGMALSLLAVYQLGNKNKFGFINFIIANLIWVWLGIFLMHSVGIAIGNFIFLIINARGFINWNKEQAKAE